MMLRVSQKELESVSLSPAEVSALLEVPERRVRKEIEHGLLPSPPVGFQAAVYLWVVHSLNDLEPSVEWRRSLLTSIRNHLVHAPLSSIPKELELVHGVSLHLRSLVEEVWERVVGEAAERPAAVKEMLEDYSSLKGEDIEFARRFARAYPRVGRPRESAKASTR